VDSDDILLAIGVSTLPCMVFDQAVYALQEWQRTRAGVISEGGFGLLGRTLISLLLNLLTSALIASTYRAVGHTPQDAFLVGACFWLVVTVPILFTSRWMDDAQKRILATRVLGWLIKTAAASASAAYFVIMGS